MSRLNKFLGEKTYKAGKGGDVMGLVNVLKGWPKDIETMIMKDNVEGALKSLKNLKTKVIPDLEKSLKARQ